MKRLLIGLFGMFSLSVVASVISYENLPMAKTVVKTKGAPHSSSTLEMHRQEQQFALQELKRHVQGELGRQVIEAKCDEPRPVIYSSEQGLRSDCSVSFL